MVAHQALTSLGFSRQEYWSGLPFPSPMHSRMLSHFSCAWLWPQRRQPTRLLCPQDSPGKSTGVGCHFLLLWVQQCVHMKLLVSTGMSHGELGRVWGSRAASYHHRRTVGLPKWGKPRRQWQAILRGYLIFKLLAHPRMVIAVRETIMHKDDLSELC